LNDLEILQKKDGFDKIERKYSLYKAIVKSAPPILGERFDQWLKHYGIDGVGKTFGIATIFAQILFFDRQIAKKELKKKKTYGFNALTSIPLFIIPRAVCICAFLIINQIIMTMQEIEELNKSK